MTDEARTRTGATTDDGKRRATTPRAEASGKTSTKTYASPTSTDAASAQATASTTLAGESTTKSSPSSASSASSPPPEASPRNDVSVNVATVTTAFHNGAKSRSVRAIQVALVARGFEPGNTEGLVDYGTRAAYAKFQKSVDERATGIPTADSLDILGFNVVG
jgi:hypothetical protein